MIWILLGMWIATAIVVFAYDYKRGIIEEIASEGFSEVYVLAAYFLLWPMSFIGILVRKLSTPKSDAGGTTEIRETGERLRRESPQPYVTTEVFGSKFVYPKLSKPKPPKPKIDEPQPVKNRFEIMDFE